MLINVFDYQEKKNDFRFALIYITFDVYLGIFKITEK